MSYDNTNRGAVWPNRKRDKETSPHFTGELNVDGVEYWVNAWKKSEGAKENAPSLSFTIRKKGEVRKEGLEDANKQLEPEGVAPPAQGFDDMDIPF